MAENVQSLAKKLRDLRADMKADVEYIAEIMQEIALAMRNTKGRDIADQLCLRFEDAEEEE